MTTLINPLPEGTLDYIHRLVKNGDLDPDCKMCIEVFYPELGKGRKITDVFAPRHKASSGCKSGKHAHCTCDTCF